MNRNKVFLIVFLSVAGFLVNECSARKKRRQSEQAPLKEPCDKCPHQGECVPKICCPAHMRPGSYNPECHLDSGTIGVCCYKKKASGRGSKKSYYVGSGAKNASVAKWKRWARKAQNLMTNPDNIIRIDSPDYGHNLALQKSEHNAAELGTGALLNMFTVQDLVQQAAFENGTLDQFLTEPNDAPYCPPQLVCPDPPSQFRSVNGVCTNQDHPTWAAANTGYERILPPDYSDGIWAIRTSVTGNPLPSPRAISAALIPDGDYPSRKHNMLMVQWGQFVAHDTTGFVVFRFSNGSAISCCASNGTNLPPEQLHWACLPILVAPDDPFFSNFGRTCLNAVRAQIAPSPDCSCGYTKQMNGVTHVPDLSQLYGKDMEKQNSLRGPNGDMKVFNNFGQQLPPLTNRSECVNPRTACFDTGDQRGNQFIPLTLVHTAFTRKHNEIVTGLIKNNPNSDPELIFYKAKQILQAIYQNIVFGEWLPQFIGVKLAKTFNLLPSSTGYATGYDCNVNPSTTVEYAVAALRMGHSTVQGNLKVSFPATGRAKEYVSIPEVMNMPDRLMILPFFTQLFNGMTSQPMQNVDPYLTEGLTKYLFRAGNAHGLDLASLNILRGRDFGIPSYNQYRRLCGLPPYLDFRDYSKNVGRRLATMYESPEDVDLWVGCLLERPVKDGIVGPTCGNIIAEQFARFKNGDRYYFEHKPDVNPGAFSLNELDELRNVTVASLMCGVQDFGAPNYISPQAFLLPTVSGNKPVDCNSGVIPTMDISKFTLN